MDNEIEKQLQNDLKIHARAVGLPDGSAESFINETIKNATKSLKNKTVITEDDLRRTIYKELKKYNSDLAYVFQNHDKII